MDPGGEGMADARPLICYVCSLCGSARTSRWNRAIYGTCRKCNSGVLRRRSAPAEGARQVSSTTKPARLTPPRGVTRWHRECALDALIGADRWPSMPLACHYAATGEDSFDGQTLLVSPKPVAEALYDMEAGGYHRGNLAAKEECRAEIDALRAELADAHASIRDFNGRAGDYT